MSIGHHHSKPSPQVTGPPRVIFFGRRCELSRIPLISLLERKIEVAAIFIANPAPFGPNVRRLPTRPSIPLGQTFTQHAADSIDDMARNHGIPLYGLRRPLGDDLRRYVDDFDPSVIVVSCFPWRIPALVSLRARHGAINLHPSPLPAFRGPDPLFWAFHQARRGWGVSVHRLTNDLDAGPLLGQVPMSIPDEVRGDVFERRVARVGGRLLADVVEQLSNGSTKEAEQEKSDASYFSFPGPHDLLIDESWSARRALNFVAGVIPVGYRPRIKSERGVFEVRSVSRTEAPLSTGECWIDTNHVVLRLADSTIEIEIGERVEID